MKQIICPIDGKPCEKSCPDRYTDRKEGGLCPDHGPGVGRYDYQLWRRYLWKSVPPCQ